MSKNEAASPGKKATQDVSTDSEGEDEFHDARFPPEEETAFLEQSHAEKSDANKLFASARYSEAVSTYDRALASCPNYLDYEVAVLRSNIAACHLKLEDWKAAVEAATSSLDCLEKALPKPTEKSSNEEKAQDDTAGGVIEIEGDDEDAELAELERLRLSDERIKDIQRIRAKSLLRRARARVELGGWANLQGAEEDYKEVVKLGNVPPQDEKVVQSALRRLPAQINEAKEKEMGEMMGKLKDLGNGILKPFGLSTDNFKFIQDQKTGGYNMSFES